MWLAAFSCITRRSIFVNHVKTKTNSPKPRLSKKQNKHCQEAYSKTATAHLIEAGELRDLNNGVYDEFH